jgi:L-fucose isomerase-like protein
MVPTGQLAGDAPGILAVGATGHVYLVVVAMLGVIVGVVIRAVWSKGSSFISLSLTTGNSLFKDVYTVMAAWGANHGTVLFGVN